MQVTFVVGRLGQDPEVKQTKGGTPYAQFSVATNERRKKGEEWVDHTEWHRCVAWGRDAENIGKFFSKGDGIVIFGQNTTDQWEDKQGNKRETTKVKVNRWEFPPGGKSSGGSGGRGEASGGAKFKDDEIPF